ncbi:orotate phosphoribosyltransferase [Thermofilum pendens]|uniref:Orotate phosphoribosyltransferase n=1 Tax=Thermofilum pendens (strain DSM 2475 / Hrk 5) TaxID=368408 RepID=A1RZB6_THEPD|nr:orotate phosphoribosyltransferase [Thermofilum pendens]ABL78546.1 orotate phosphoribosyltransferase [Thermofilum pendens Hrk 5]
MIEEILWEIGAVKTGEFRLTSGKVSNVYIDLRKLPSHPQAFRRVVEALAAVARTIEFDAVCGIAVGGLPIATALAYTLGKPLIYARREKKAHGTMKQLEGDYARGMKVLLVDDVATTGGTLLDIARLLKSEGLEVVEALVVVDREEGASEALRSEGLRLRSLTTLKKVLSARA